MPPRSLYDLPLDGLQQLLAEAGLKAPHALRLFQALYQELELHPAERNDFLPPLRKWLEQNATQWLAGLPHQAALLESEDGWTRKFLFELGDGRRIESVLMGFSGRLTGCISTQVGCAMGCVFCATGHGGLQRHLLPGEIVSQVLLLNRLLVSQSAERLRNLVLMGMGEPLHNLENVLTALEIITDTRGLNIGPSRVTISTVGHVPGILRLAQQPRRYNLAVSLHACTDEERAVLVPVTKRWPLTELLAACDQYADLTGQRVLMAWTLIAGQNDSDDQARQLADLLRGRNVQVNLIPLNPTDGFAGTAPEPKRIHAFQRIVQESGLPATVRQRRGIDVAAGCGQLSHAGHVAAVR